MSAPEGGGNKSGRERVHVQINEKNIRSTVSNKSINFNVSWPFFENENKENTKKNCSRNARSERKEEGVD